MKIDWIKDIPGWETIFNSNERAIIDAIGLDNFGKLIEVTGGQSIYFSKDAWLNAARKKWCAINKSVPYNEAARTLGVSVSAIYNWRKETNTDNLELFEEGK